MTVTISPGMKAVNCDDGIEGGASKTNVRPLALRVVTRRAVASTCTIVPVYVLSADHAGAGCEVVAGAAVF